MTINVVSFHAKKVKQNFKNNSVTLLFIADFKMALLVYKYAEFWALKTYPAFK